MHHHCTKNCHERTGPHSARSEQTVLSELLSVFCTWRYDENPYPSKQGCGNLQYLWISATLSIISEKIMSQDQIKSKKKVAGGSPGGFHDLKPTIWVGKQGITDTIIEEIRSQIKTRKVIKVKWLESTSVDPEEVAGGSGTVVLQVRGRTMVLGESGSSSTPRSRNI